MPRPSIDHLLHGADLGPTLSLKQDENMDRFYRYELATINALREVEKLTQNLAEGAALDLFLQDEFCLKTDKKYAHEAIYGINKRGRLWQIFYCLENIDDALKAIPVEHLSIHAQAFHRAFITSHSLQDKNPHHSSIKNATSELLRGNIERPKYPYQGVSLSEARSISFIQNEAEKCLEVTNDHLCYLVNLLRHPEVKKQNRLSKNQARRHESTIRELFKQSFKKTPEIMAIFLDLSTPKTPHIDNNNLYRNATPPINYEPLNEARKSFLKKRNYHDLFNGLIGYAWKYRYTYGEGITCMMVLIYNAELESQQYSLTHALGKYWVSVSGQGSHYKTPSLNGNKMAQKQYFGLLKKDSEEAQHGIDALARFMGLYQMYVKPEASKNRHTFGTSSIKKTTRKKKKQPPQKKTKENRKPASDAEA